jgi:hypothetical protein
MRSALRPVPPVCFMLLLFMLWSWKNKLLVLGLNSKVPSFLQYFNKYCKHTFILLTFAFPFWEISEHQS